MEMDECPYCRENIIPGAIKCKHCGSMLEQKPVPQQPSTIQPSNQSVSTEKKNGTLWLPIPSLVLGLMALISFADDSYWDMETLMGVMMFAVIGLVLGIVSLNTQKAGKGMAIAGIVLSAIALLAGIGMYVE